jgi:hypothetical protein
LFHLRALGGVLNVSSPSINSIVCDGTQMPWRRSLTIITQDEPSLTTSGTADYRHL